MHRKSSDVNDVISLDSDIEICLSSDERPMGIADVPRRKCKLKKYSYGKSLKCPPHPTTSPQSIISSFDPSELKNNSNSYAQFDSPPLRAKANTIKNDYDYAMPCTSTGVHRHFPIKDLFSLVDKTDEDFFNDSANQAQLEKIFLEGDKPLMDNKRKNQLDFDISTPKKICFGSDDENNSSSQCNDISFSHVNLVTSTQYHNENTSQNENKSKNLNLVEPNYVLRDYGVLEYSYKLVFNSSENGAKMLNYSRDPLNVPNQVGENAENVENIENTENFENFENAENTENAENVESVENNVRNDSLTSPSPRTVLPKQINHQSESESDNEILITMIDATVIDKSVKYKALKKKYRFKNKYI